MIIYSYLNIFIEEITYLQLIKYKSKKTHVSITMRPRHKPPLNKRYFHTKPQKDRRDMQSLKNRIDSIHKDALKKNLKDKRRERKWRI